MTASGGRDRLVPAGLVVTAVGLLCTAVALVPLISSVELPGVFWGLSMLTGVGLALILVGLFRGGLRRSRSQRRVTAG